MVRVTPVMLAALKRDAAMNERSVAQTVRRAVRLYFTGEEYGDATEPGDTP
jgi:hypothetical protein